MTDGLEDIWEQAFRALPDMRPIARLIRSDVPMPPAARYRLAALLTPGNPPMWEWKFSCEENKDFKKVRRNLDVEDKYRGKMADGIRSEEAAEQAGSQYNIGDRRVHQIMEMNAGERLQERLHARMVRYAFIKMFGKAGGRIPGDE